MTQACKRIMQHVLSRAGNEKRGKRKGEREREREREREGGERKGGREKKPSAFNILALVVSPLVYERLRTTAVRHLRRKDVINCDT